MIIAANIILLFAVFILVMELCKMLAVLCMEQGTFRPITLAVTVTYIVAYFTFIR